MALCVILVAIYLILPLIVEEIALAKISSLGIPCDVHCRMGCCWTSTGPGIRANLKAFVIGSPWSIDANLTASPFQWHATVQVPEISFDHRDHVLSRLLADHPPKSVDDLTFSGSIAIVATADRTFSFPLPKWKVEAKLNNFFASGNIGSCPIRIQDMTMGPVVTGIADHADVNPIHLFIKSIDFGAISVGELKASLRIPDMKRLVVDVAIAKLWDGSVSLYAVHFDPQTLNAALTLFIDDANADEVMSSLTGFFGKASGRLHGKIKIHLLEGGTSVVLRDAFLYSVPGTTGKLCIKDPERMTETLQLTGLDHERRQNIANALTDLDYSVLKFDIKRNNGPDAEMNMRLEGKATRNHVTVPVMLDLTVRGAIEQIINTSIMLNRAKKGKIK